MAITNEGLFVCDFCGEDTGKFDNETGNHVPCQRLHAMQIALFRPRLYKDGWHYAVVKGQNKFIGLAKKEPFTSDEPNPIKEPGELFFEFGDTPIEAFHAIVIVKKEVAHEEWCEGTPCNCGAVKKDISHEKNQLLWRDFDR